MYKDSKSTSLKGTLKINPNGQITMLVGKECDEEVGLLEALESYNNLDISISIKFEEKIVE